MNELKLSVLMPTYKNPMIGEIVTKAHDAIISKFEPGTVEFIVTEDGSGDSTPELLKRLAPKCGITPNLCSKNRGYLAVSKELYALAKGEYLFFMDSDGEHDPADFWLLWNEMKEKNWDIVVGYKLNRRPYSRLLISKANNFLLGMFFGIWLNDANCGFRIIKRDVAQQLVPKVGNLPIAPNAEQLVWAKRMNYRFAQVGVKHINQESVTFTPGIKMLPVLLRAFKDLLVFRLRIGSLQ